jgi:short-subunit dehydrogenase
VNLADRYGPWAVVAGASEGTGRAFARQLAAHGIPCVLVARREAPLMALVDEIRRESGTECVAATVDLAAPDAMEQIVTAVGDRGIGLFVANAGGDPNGALFLDRDVATWLELVQRNVVTLLRCCHHFARPMRARGRGGLLLVNSGACYGGSSFMAAYAASKAFQLSFSESLWIELRPYGVDVLTLVLNQTDTPALRALLADRGLPVPAGLADPDEVARRALEQLPHGPIHNWGLADEVAGYAVSPAAVRRMRVEAVDRASRRIFGSAK